MQSAQKHTFINTKNLQGSIFFRTFKYFLAQHSLKQLIFSLLLFCSLFSFAQEENSTSFYINPNTTIVVLDYINLKQNTKLVKQEKEQSHLYIVENTIFFSSQNLATVTIKDSDESQKLSENNKCKVSKDDYLVITKEQSHLYIVENTIFFSSQDLVTVTIESNNPTQKLSENKKHKVFKEYLVKVKQQVVKAQSKTQVTQAPFPFSLPIEQKQTIIVAAGSITIVTPSTFSKTVSKALTIQNYFSLFFQESISQKQKTICYNQNSKPFQVKTKHCNRPPPVLYC